MALSAPDASPPATGYLAAPPPPPLSDAGADALPARARARRDAVFVPRELSHAAISQYCSVAYDDTARDGDDRRYSHRPATNGHVAKRRLTTGAAAHAKCYDTHVNRVLYGWLQQNIDNPYPSPQAKLELMKKSGLSKMQLKNWFCNIRRRKLPSSIKHQKPRK
ncbi:Homeobox protein tos8 [Coemansia helicoidea]|nr:Homeobox protein tos8 [Coemansia helicoidea]